MTQRAGPAEMQLDVARDMFGDAANAALEPTEKLEMERALEWLSDSLWELWRLSGGQDS